MFTKILVPLDGSDLAERALKPAFALAQKFQSEIHLLRIAMPEEVVVGFAAVPLYPYDLRNAEEEAGAYLNRIQRCWLGANAPILTEVVKGAPPEMIVAAANAHQVDLIVMSTHGRSGFERVIYGSVAEAVIRGSPVPVLLVPSRTRQLAEAFAPMAIRAPLFGQ